MPLSSTRKSQIQDAIRSLSAQVRAGDSNPALEQEIQTLQLKLAQDTESPNLSTPPVQIDPREEPIPTTQDFDVPPVQIDPKGAFHGSDTFTPVERQSSIDKARIKELEGQVQQESSLKTGTTETFQNQLEQLRAQNTAFSAALSQELGLSTFDEDLKRIEDQQLLLVDREDEANKKSFQDLSQARRTGILNEDEYQQKLADIVKAQGKSLEFAGKETTPLDETVDREVVPGTGEETVPEPTETQTEIVEALPEGVTKDNTTGVVTYTNPDTNVTFKSDPNTGTIDFAGLTDEELLKLDGTQLLQAEIKMGLQSLDADEAIDDAFFKDMLDVLRRSEEDSRDFIIQNQILTLNEAENQEQIAQDQIAFSKQINESQKAFTFEEIAANQAEMEGYLKGKLSAYGAGKSSAALAVMSSNQLKFARIKAKAGLQYDAQAGQLERMSIASQMAYTNTIAKINLQASKNMSDLSISSQTNLLNLMQQKLKSDAQKDSERGQLRLAYVKGIKGIEADKAKAEADALKDARSWFKDQIQMAGWMENQTGTIWAVDSQGQMYDTRQESQDAMVDRQKLELAWAKLQKSLSGGGGGGIASAEEIKAWVDKMRGLGLSDDEINREMTFRWPGTAQKHTDVRNAARDYLQDTTTETTDILIRPSDISSAAGDVSKFFDAMRGADNSKTGIKVGEQKKVFRTPIPKGIAGEFFTLEAAGALPSGVYDVSSLEQYKNEQEIDKILGL